MWNEAINSHSLRRRSARRVSPTRMSSWTPHPGGARHGACLPTHELMDTSPGRRSTRRVSPMDASPGRAPRHPACIELLPSLIPPHPPSPPPSPLTPPHPPFSRPPGDADAQNGAPRSVPLMELLISLDQGSLVDELQAEREVRARSERDGGEIGARSERDWNEIGGTFPRCGPP